MPELNVAALAPRHPPHEQERNGEQSQEPRPDEDVRPHRDTIMLGPCVLEISFGAAGRSVCHRARLAHAGRISNVHISRSGSRRSGSPWTTKVSPPTVS